MGDTSLSLTQTYWNLYRFRGLNPIPSCPTDKKPLIKFVDRYGWDTMLPNETLDQHPTTNLQIQCGRHWGLLVIDLDGPEAVEVFERRVQMRLRDLRGVWVSHSGGGGRHVWFSVPEDAPEMPKSFLWKGGGPHEAVERLCDRSLVIAPPSIHPKTGRPYTFDRSYASPVKVGRPAMAPPSILNWKPIVTRPAIPARRNEAVVPKRIPARRNGMGASRNEILEAIPDKVALARSWGLIPAGKPTQSGWQPCYAVAREDHVPSAAIRLEDGYYVDRGTDTRLTLFDLGVAMGVYSDFRSALIDLENTYHVVAARSR